MCWVILDVKIYHGTPGNMSFVGNLVWVQVHVRKEMGYGSLKNLYNNRHEGNQFVVSEAAQWFS